MRPKPFRLDYKSIEFFWNSDVLEVFVDARRLECWNYVATAWEGNWAHLWLSGSGGLHDEDHPALKSLHRGDYVQFSWEIGNGLIRASLGDWYRHDTCRSFTAHFSRLPATSHQFEIDDTPLHEWIRHGEKQRNQEEV